MLGYYTGMSSNVRAKIIAAGLLATAAVMLPACAPNVVNGKAVPSAAEPTTTSVVAAPTVTTPVVPSSKEEKTPAIPPRYNTLIDAVKDASHAAKLYFKEQGLPMGDVMIKAALEQDSVPSCTPNDPGAYPAAWACSNNDPREIVFHLPSSTRKVFGPGGNPGVAIAIGHEYGHMALPMMDRRADTGGRKEERRADCVAGAFMMWYSQNGGPTINQVRNVVAKMYPDQGGVSANRLAIEHGMANGLGSCVTYDDGFGN